MFTYFGAEVTHKTNITWKRMESTPLYTVEMLITNVLDI